MSDERRRYRINWVAEQTGIPETTLRAWERRYGVPEPDRTPSGYRIYSVQDVEKVRRMRQLCAGGMSPSEAALAVAESLEQTAESRVPTLDAVDELRFSEVLGPALLGPRGSLSLSGVLALMEHAAAALAAVRLRLTAVPRSCGPVQLEAVAKLGDSVVITASLRSVEAQTAVVEVQLTLSREGAAPQSLSSGQVTLALSDLQGALPLAHTP